MARKPQVRYFGSRGAYYFQFKGKQHKLAEGPDDGPTGPTYLAALGRFQQILELDVAPQAKNENTVAVICELYLRHVNGKRSEGTFNIRQSALTDFCQTHGKKTVASLTHQDVYAYCDSKRERRTNTVHWPNGAKHRKGRKVLQWGDGTVRTFVQSLNACLNWGVRSGLLNKNPLAGIEVPSVASRGAKSLITPEQHKSVLDAASPRIRQVLICLEATGCRPSELANATAKDWDDVAGTLTYHKAGVRRDGYMHKTTRKGKTRTIFFIGPALDLMRELVRRHPAGYLFRPYHRDRQTRKWDKRALVQRFATIRRKLGLPETITCYSYRHTFATNFLKGGGSIEILAELLGNSAKILREHYSHLLSDKANLRAHLERVMSSK